MNYPTRCRVHNFTCSTELHNFTFNKELKFLISNTINSGYLFSDLVKCKDKFSCYFDLSFLIISAYLLFIYITYISIHAIICFKILFLF